MRIVQFFIIIFIGLLLGACGKEDNRVCAPAEFIGNYVGSTACANGGISDATISVTMGATDTELAFDVDGSIFTAEIDGCNFLGSQKDANVDLEYSGSLDGDVIEVNLKGIVFMVVFDCTATGRRQ